MASSSIRPWRGRCIVADGNAAAVRAAGLVRRQRLAAAALLRSAANADQPVGTGTPVAGRCGPGHPAGARRPRRFHRLRHLAQQPRPGTPRRHERRLTGELTISRRSRKTSPTATTCCPIAATCSPIHSAPVRPTTRFSTPPARRSSTCPTACKVTSSSTPTTSASTRARLRSSAIRSGPIVPSRPAFPACRATRAASSQGRSDPRSRRQESQGVQQGRCRA